MAPHSSTLAWKIPGRRSLVGCSHGVAKSQTRLSDFTFTFHFYALEKGMATHSSILPWRIPGTEEPSGLSSVGSHRVRQLSSSSSSSIIVVSYYKIMAIFHCAVSHCLFSVALSCPEDQVIFPSHSLSSKKTPSIPI